jgi:hypothetical protein
MTFLDVQVEKVSQWKFRPYQKERWLKTLKRQKLANLTPFMIGDKTIRRWQVTNKDL